MTNRTAVLAALTLLYNAHLAAQSPPQLIYTDGTVMPGGVYTRAAGGTEQTLVQALTGSIHSTTVDAGGVVYVVDANKNDIQRSNGDNLRLVYHHSTRVHDVAFDPKGQLYFSAATGAGGDGRIYRLDDGVATLFYTVSLGTVGGFWAGDFAFAPDGALHLSSGTIRGASLYRVQAGTPVAIYTDPSGSISGFDFDAEGNIFYADLFQHIYKVSPEFTRTIVLDVPGRRFADVAVLTRSLVAASHDGYSPVTLQPNYQISAFQYIAQVFTVAYTGSITKIDLLIKNEAPDWAGTRFYAYITRMTYGSPPLNWASYGSGPLTDEATVQGPPRDGAYHWVSGTFARPLMVRAGEVYAIEAYGSAGWLWANDRNSSGFVSDCAKPNCFSPSLGGQFYRVYVTAAVR